MDSEQQNSNSCRRQTLWLKTIVDNRLKGFNYPWRQATVTLTTNPIRAKTLFREKIFWGGGGVESQSIFRISQFCFNTFLKSDCLIIVSSGIYLDFTEEHVIFQQITIFIFIIFIKNWKVYLAYVIIYYIAYIVEIRFWIILS